MARPITMPGNLAKKKMSTKNTFRDLKNYWIYFITFYEIVILIYTISCTKFTVSNFDFSFCGNTFVMFP